MTLFLMYTVIWLFQYSVEVYLRRLFIAMAIALAQAHHIFGLRSNISGNINYLDEQTVIFPSGNLLVRFNLEFKQQRFISGTDKSQGMVQCCLLICFLSNVCLATTLFFTFRFDLQQLQTIGYEQVFLFFVVWQVSMIQVKYKIGRGPKVYPFTTPACCVAQIRCRK